MIDISAVLKQKERFNVEAKLAKGGLPRSVWETYSSFANTFGGVILLGVEENQDTRELVPRGVSSPDQMITDIWSTLNNRQKVSANILLERHVYPVEINGAVLVVIEVPRAERHDKPVFIGQDMFKGTYRRNHEGDYRCSVNEVKAMLRDQGDTTQDGLMLEHLMVADLNQDSIARYRMIFDRIKKDHLWSGLSDEEFLMKIGAAKKSQVDGKIHPTLAGLLFFGDFNTITDELPDYFLDYRERLSEESRWSDRVCSGDGNWSGNIFDFYFKVIDRLTSDVKKPFMLDNNLMRVDDTRLHVGLRECLANALIHADYYGRRGIVIDKNFNQITISNPGTFRIEIEEAIAGGISDARNGKIFNMFSLINIGERSGSGLCDIFRVWEGSGLGRPQITESVKPERITIILNVNVGNFSLTSKGNPDMNDGNHDGNCDVNDGNPAKDDGNREGNHDANDGNLADGDGNCDVNDGNPANDDVNRDGNLGINDGKPTDGDGNREGNLDPNDGNLAGDDVNPEDNLTENEWLVLRYLALEPGLSAVKLSRNMSISRSTAERVLQSLKKKGRIRREGTTRGKWIILKK